MLQIGASLTDDTRSINYDCNMFIIQATNPLKKWRYLLTFFVSTKKLNLQAFYYKMQKSTFQEFMSKLDPKLLHRISSSDISIHPLYLFLLYVLFKI